MQGERHGMIVSNLSVIPANGTAGISGHLICAYELSEHIDRGIASLLSMKVTQPHVGCRTQAANTEGGKRNTAMMEIRVRIPEHNRDRNPKRQRGW